LYLENKLTIFSQEKPKKILSKNIKIILVLIIFLKFVKKIKMERIKKGNKKKIKNQKLCKNHLIL
jgi:hypothetical protein